MKDAVARHPVAAFLLIGIGVYLAVVLIAPLVETEILPFCRAAGLGTLPWGPLGAGFLTGYYEPEFQGSRTPDATYRVPLLDRPQDLVTIPQSKIGYVYARDGDPLTPGQTLGRVVASNNFQDARAFLANGFKVRVVHCWWTFESVEGAAHAQRGADAGDRFGRGAGHLLDQAGEAVADDLSEDDGLRAFGQPAFSSPGPLADAAKEQELLDVHAVRLPQPRRPRAAHFHHAGDRRIEAVQAWTAFVELGDEYLSIEHVILAMADKVGVSREDLLAALQEVRGSHRVTSQNPEEQYQALERYGRDLTDEDVAAIQARLDRLDRASTHGSWTDATLRLIAANPETRAAELAASQGREFRPA